LLNILSDRVVIPVDLVLELYDQSNYASDYTQYDGYKRISYSRNGETVSVLRAEKVHHPNANPTLILMLP